MANNVGLQAITVMALLTGFGVLFVVLGCALADNWWPLMSLFIFIFAGVPLLLCGEPTGTTDFIVSSPDSILTDQAQFLTGFFAVSGIALNLVLRHGDVIQTSTLLWTLMGFATLAVAIGFFLWTLKKPSDLILS
eukprot:EG_transcript_24909